jgi:diguanylate cyclase (GGDEF)-like protein
VFREEFLEHGMLEYPVVDNESLRLETLRALEIVGSPRSMAFDAITQLAADTFACPIAFVSLLDDNQQWFKASCGLGTPSTPRSVAFCNHTILGTDVFIVENARRDPRFASNPLVTGAPGVRFYAGVPITIEGHRVGAFCVNDTRPRHFSDADAERLRQFGRIVEELVSAHGLSVRAAAAARDLADHAQLLWKKNRLLAQVERIGKIGGWELDIASKQIDWSDEVFHIHELPVGRPPDLETALSFYPSAWRSAVWSTVEKTIETGEPYDFEAEFVTALGRKKWVRAAGECELHDGKPVRLFGMFQDITQEKAAAERLWHSANFDDLTGLANRRHFKQTLESTITHASKRGDSVTLMILDLDNFKQINDTRGHAFGDEILHEVGRRLSSSVPAASFVARLGGDEFAVVLPATRSTATIEKCGRRILAHLRNVMRIQSSHVYITGSLGIARFPDDAANSAELLKMADLGLYRAKHADRGSLQLYSPTIARLFEERSDSIELVRTALSKRRLLPFYQPKVHLSDGRRCGFEALVRILADDGSATGPAEFGSALLDRDMALRIGDRMLRTVTADIASWRKAGIDPGSVSINVGEADFADGKLADRVLGRLEELSLPASCLTVEVTESVFMGEDATLVREALEKLDAAGLGIELDDFGTGYASLTHLRAFPINKLKIDRSFIRDLGPNEESRVIVQAVIDLGHNLGCEIVAEGVETDAQADLLRGMGCDAGQGYLFGRPASARETRAALLNDPASQARMLRVVARRHLNGSTTRSGRESVAARRAPLGRRS